MPTDKMKEKFANLWEMNGVLRERLKNKAEHMALGIPHDGSHITTGVGWKELAIIAIGGMGMVSIAGGTILVCCMLLMNNAEEQQTDAPAQPAATSETIQIREEYDIVFFDEQGNPITVERRPLGGNE